MAQTSIEWTESSWNPVTGCSKLSLGCKNCYAERFAHRLQAMGNPNYTNGFAVTLHPHMLEVPVRWTQPQMVFVNSMSDLFHSKVPLAFIRRVFDVMERCRQHVFQVLTKRSERLLKLSTKLSWPDNVWMGVTVEHPDYTFRIKHLRQTGAKVKFLSCEPLLGPIPRLPLKGIDWVIVGGESGPGARVIRKEWVLQIRDRCLKVEVPFFFKQWGGTHKKKSGRMLEGKLWDEMPALIRS